ncbi:MAG: hypothetical protein ABWW65_05220 [Thermoprotei archaeon]
MPKLSQYLEQLPKPCREDIEKIVKLDQEINLPGNEEIERITKLLKILGNPLRLKILYLLKEIRK